MASYYIDENGVLRSTDDDEEYEVRNGKLKKKKKKNTSSKDSTGSAGGDIAPDLSGLDPAAQMGAAAGQAILKWFNKDSEDDRTWFQKGGKTTEDKVVGTTRDVGTDFTAGLVGIGEKIIDWGASVAPLISKGQYYANGGGYNPQADKIFEESNKKFQDEVIAPFVKKDLYDEQKVAKRIVAGLEFAAYLYNINQSGAFATPEQVQFANQMRGDALKYMATDENGFSQMEADSVLGDKSDALIQSAGQLAGTSVLAMAGVPWYLTTGASTWGAEAENALNQGATLEEANLSGMISAGAEILTEKISGGIKIPGIGKTADDAIVNALGRNISNKVVRTLAKMGVDMAGEGAEEVLSGVISALGQKLTYASEKEWEELFSKEDAWEAFIGGAVLGGGGSVTSAVQGKINGVDSVTNMTADEESVVRNLYDKAIEQSEKDGKTKNTTEKRKLWDELSEKMEKGYISAEDIESVLGGEKHTLFTNEAKRYFGSEDFKAYKKAKDAEDAARKEFDPLVKMKQGEMTGEQIYRRDELKKILDESKVKELETKLSPETERIMNLRNMMRSEVFERVKGTKLEESYNELARKQQKYEVDVEQYEGKAKETVQNIIDSGLGDNSNQFHELVDFLAKISNDKGVTFNFTKTELLKGTKHYKEGYITNGFVDDNGNVVLNKDSNNAIHTIVGHEVTHVLEKTDSYKTLQAAVRDYCIAKEGLDKYNARLKAAEEAYKGKKNTTPEGEVTADIIGEYLFTDSEFVNKLSTDDRSTFEKIYDEIKYLWKVATAGSHEKRELERVKKIFDKAWRENVKGKTEVTEKSSNTEAAIDPENDSDLDYENPNEYSLSEIVDENQNSYGIGVHLDSTLLDNLTPKERVSMVKEYVKELGGETFTAYDQNGNPVEVKIAEAREKFPNKKGKAVAVNKDLTTKYIGNEVKQEAIALVDELIIASEYDGSKPAAYSHGWLDNNGQNGWEYWKTYIQDKNNTIWEAILNIANSADGEKVLYDISPIKKVGRSVKSDTLPTGDNVPQSGGNVKYSFTKDSNGNDLTDAQKEFFKDSKVVDENGNLKVMYHGTPNGDFTVFKDGTYFTDNKEYADKYQNPGASSIGSGKVATAPKTFEVYLDIKKPFDINDAEARDIYINEYIKGGNAMGINPYLSDAEYAKIKTIDWTEGEDLRDFLIDNEYDYDGLVLDEGATGGYGDEVSSRGTSWVVFNPNQVKNVDNANPTADPDIRYSFTKADSDYMDAVNNGDTKLAEFRVEEMANIAMPDSKIRDKKGRLIPVYHGTNADFWEFDTSRDGGKNGTAEGFGIYLSDNQEVTNAYGDRQIKMFANITKPATSFKKTIKANTLVKLIKHTCETEAKRMVAEDGYDSLKDALRDTWVSNYADTYGSSMDQVYRELAHSFIQNNDNDKDIIHEVMFGMAIRSYDQAMAFYRTSLTPVTGIDGFITEWDNANTGETSTIYLAFDSSQLKSADAVTYDESGNIIPLSERFNPDKKDIRYSLSPEDAAPGYGYVPSRDIGVNDEFAPIREDAESVKTESIAPDVDVAENETATEEHPRTRKALHESIVEDIRGEFARRGADFDEALKKAKNLSTFATVDNTPQRVMEKSLGYKEGGIFADLTVNKVAQDETEKIKWLNSYLDRKNGVLAHLSKKYHIKSGSKEEAAVQMYAEGFYVNEQNEIIAYGDNELAKDFPDINVQRNIKALVNDPTIRKIYDETLDMINEARRRNLYPEIPRLDNYYLHYRAMDDTFSKLGLPFNPNDIRAKDLPTDLNGVTADLKPGQPYFASAKHREGKRTSFGVFTGLEKYLTSAANQIFHIDNIQTLRALRNHLADTYGQANGLEGLDELTEEEAQERIKEVYSSHLSTFAKFLNEEANVLAGKTALIDRGIEGIIGRRGITFLDTINRQVGSNAVGYSASSAIVNFDAIPRAFVKANKADFVKAFGQMVVNAVSRKSDGFAENSPVIIRRKGAERFHRTLWQKMSDPGYALMGKVDEISTELIARAKYNELTRKGMDAQKAHFETDKWVSKLMGDRSLGQQPQIFNSKMLGLLTKFQLEVRNNLDSMFYDSIQEAKVSNEHIQNNLERNARTAAKATAKIAGLAIAQHIFGKAFESVAGYNPSFDIIEAVIKAFGWDDEEEEPILDNLEEAFLTVVEDMPYSSVFTGGRIPIQNALPIKELVTGIDEYGNEKSRWETLGEIAPYYLMPGGYGQIKKTTQGLGMFLGDHPIDGSYTDSGNLRFPVEDHPLDVAQAALFGQYSSKNARDYFDNDWAPLAEKQITEYSDLGIDFRKYHEIREGLKDYDTLAEKVDYIYGLDISDEQKNILVNNLTDRKTPIDMSNYGEYGSFEEFDYAQKNPDKYEFFKGVGISYDDYASADEEGKREYSSMYEWVKDNPGKYEMSKAISDDFLTYWQYKGEMGDLKADKDSNGKTISGSKKEKVIDYINNLDLDYGQKIILFRSMYDSQADREAYNSDILEYLNSRDDISYEEMVTILTELGFKVNGNQVTWD